MAEFTEALNDRHVEMIGKQPVFFVATAAADGRIDLSPRGSTAFACSVSARSATSISAARETRRMHIGC